MQTKEKKKDWDTTGLSQQQEGKNTRRRSTAMSSQTAYTVASSGSQKKKKNYLDIDVYVRPPSYNRLCEGLGHNGTVTATNKQTKTTTRSIAMSSQTAYTVASSGGYTKMKFFYLDIDV